MDPADGTDPLADVGRFMAALRSYDVRDLVVTGSAALGVWASPRQSRDIDLCAEVPSHAVPAILARFDGIAAGPPEDPRVLRLRFLSWDVDIFVSGGDPYDRACAARAVEVSTAGGPVPVVTAEDLLIHKLIKLRSDRRRLLQDLADLRAVIEARADRLEWAYLEQWLPETEVELLRAVASLDDEALARRLLGLVDAG